MRLKSVRLVMSNRIILQFKHRKVCRLRPVKLRPTDGMVIAKDRYEVFKVTHYRQLKPETRACELVIAIH